MDAAVAGAAAAVLGSLVGGSATIATAWITQANVNRRDLVLREARRRERLYEEFIGVATTLAIDAYTHALDAPERLLPAYALANRMRLASSDAVVEAAERAVARIADQYFARNLPVDELRALAGTPDANPLREFSDACRAELARLRPR